MTIETGDRALPPGPDSYGRLAADAQQRLRGGNASGAIDAYAAALLLRPNDFDGQLALGEAFRSAKRWQDGMAFYASLAHDHPGDPWIQYDLAVMQQGLGNFDAARAAISDFVTSVPDITNGDRPAMPSTARITATRHAVMSATGTT